MTSSFASIVENSDEERTYGTLDLLKCKPGDSVIVSTANSMYVIVITAKMYYDSSDESVRGVLVASSNARTSCHSKSSLNKVSRYLSIPSRIHVNNSFTSNVRDVKLNNVSICPLFR